MSTRQGSWEISRRRMLQTALALTVGGGTSFSSFLARGADTTKRARGLALTIGMGAVDPSPSGHYGSANPLRAPRKDAMDMAQFARDIKLSDSKTEGAFWDVRCLLDNETGDKKGTIENVRKHILDASARLEEGDFFLVYYSGHGAYKANTNSDVDPEASGTDQTWCLFDNQWIDDDRGRLWTAFKPNVRILLINDCCFSGSTAKTLLDLANFDIVDKDASGRKSAMSKVAAKSFDDHDDLKELHARLAKTAAAANPAKNILSKSLALPDGAKSMPETKEFTDLASTIRFKRLPEPLASALAEKQPVELSKDHPQWKNVSTSEKGDRVAEETKAFVYSMSACSDYTTALDAIEDDGNSVFTDIFKSVFKTHQTRPFNNYSEFFEAIVQIASKGFPIPKYQVFGKGTNFSDQKPFWVS